MLDLAQLVSILLQSPRSADEVLVELARDSGNDDMSRRTLLRDIARLKQLGWLEFEPRRRYHAAPGPKLPLLIAPGEAEMLKLARLLFEQLGLPEADLLEALLARASSRVMSAAEPIALNLPPSIRTIDPVIWASIQEGLAKGRRLRLRYRKPDLPEETITLDRAKLVWMTGAFYLCAFRPDYAEASPELPLYRHVREYRLDRIQAIDVLDECVQLAVMPTMLCTFILDGEMQGRVSDLHDATGQLVQKVWPRPDGTLKVQTREFGFVRARQRLLMFGAHLLAIEEPFELKLEIRRSLKELTERLRD